MNAAARAARLDLGMAHTHAEAGSIPAPATKRPVYEYLAQRCSVCGVFWGEHSARDFWSHAEQERKQMR